MKKISELKFINKLQNVPVAFSGIALGIGGLGNAWMNLYPTLSWLKYVTIPIVIVLILMLFTKNIFHRKVFLSEIKEPLLSSFLPTFTMCLMLIAGFVASFSKEMISASQIIATIIMCLAVSVQFILIITFIIFVIKKHDWHNHPMYGSWFVPTVGLITACTVAPNFSILPPLFFQIIWFIGFVFYVLTFLPITYSLLFKTKPSIERYPSIAVYFAPANLTPSGFIQSFWFADVKFNHTLNTFTYHGFFNPHFVYVMLLILIPFGLVMSFFLYVFLIKIFKNKFSFIFASLSFPLAISSTTMILVYKMSINYSFGATHIDFITSIAWASFIFGNIFVSFSTIIILYIFIRMIVLLIKIFIKIEKAEEKELKKQKRNKIKENKNA